MNLSGILLAGGKSRRLGINKLQINVGPVPLFIDQVFKLSFFCNEIIISTSNKNYPLIKRECGDIKKHLKYYSEITKTNTLNGTRPGGSVKSFLDNPEIKIVLDDLDEIETGKIPRETGPIAGIYSGLNNAINHYSFILAFDMPFISFRMLKTLVDIIKEDTGIDEKESSSNKEENMYDACIIKTEKGFEVLSGIYSKSCMNALENNIIKKDNKISNIFKHIKVRIIEKEILGSKNLDMLNFFNINKIEDYQRFKNIWYNEFFECKYTFKSGGSNLNRWAEFFFR